MASQIGVGPVGVIYVIDEPSISLHQRDNKRLLETLLHLRDLGNTLIVVEHDEEAIRIADYIIDISPGVGIYGDQIMAEGTTAEIIANPALLTGKFLGGKREIIITIEYVTMNPKRILKLVGGCGNNLKDVTLILPIGLFTCITGVSGSGKSTLINDTLFPVAQRQLNGTHA